MNAQETRLREQQSEEQRVAHEQWLQHPGTQQLLARLKFHEDNLINAAVVNSEAGAKSDEYFRHKMIAVRTARAIKLIITERMVYTNEIQ